MEQGFYGKSHGNLDDGRPDKNAYYMNEINMPDMRNIKSVGRHE